MEAYRGARRAELVLQGQILCEQISTEAAADDRFFLKYETGMLSEQEYRIEKQRISEKMFALEHRFEEVMRQAEQLDKLYSRQNP